MGAGAQLCSRNGIGQAVYLLVSVCVSFSFSFGVFLTYFSVTNRRSPVRPGSKLTMWNLFYDMSKCRPGCPCYLHNCFGNNHSELNAGWSFPMTPLPQAVIRFPEGGVRSWSRTPLVYDPDSPALPTRPWAPPLIPSCSFPPTCPFSSSLQL